MTFWTGLTLTLASLCGLVAGVALLITAMCQEVFDAGR